MLILVYFWSQAQWNLSNIDCELSKILTFVICNDNACDYRDAASAKCHHSTYTDCWYYRITKTVFSSHSSERFHCSKWSIEKRTPLKSTENTRKSAYSTSSNVQFCRCMTGALVTDDLMSHNLWLISEDIHRFITR